MDRDFKLPAFQREVAFPVAVGPALVLPAGVDAHGGACDVFPGGQRKGRAHRLGLCAEHLPPAASGVPPWQGLSGERGWKWRALSCIQ